MRQKTSRVRILRYLITGLTIALCLVLITSRPADAQSPGDYFSFTYNVVFSKSQISGSETFTATIETEVTSTNALPVSVSKASLTSRIIAEHQTSGARVTLNSSYTINIDPFPSTVGETTQTSEVVSLQFPQGSQSGTYSIVAELIEAKIKVIVWLTVTDALPSSQAMGSITYTSGGGGGDGGGGGGGGLSIPPSSGLSPGTRDVSAFVSDDGTFTETVLVESLDGKCELTISEGTKGLTQAGERLAEITMIEMEEPPAPPEHSDIIGLTYDLGPDGASFDPPITLTFTYYGYLIPEGVAEENLAIAMWDEVTGEWVVLTGYTVDPETNTITVPVSHFTTFAVLTHILPADFAISELSITPAEVAIGEEVTISALVMNTSGLTGSYKVTLKVDNEVIATREVTLEGGASEEVVFTTTADVAGAYAVTIEGLSGEFIVKRPSLINWYILAAGLALVVVISLAVVIRRRRF